MVLWGSCLVLLGCGSLEGFIDLRVEGQAHISAIIRLETLRLHSKFKSSLDYVLTVCVRKGGRELGNNSNFS